MSVAATAPSPAAVIFDMDGLMLDTEPLAARAWVDAAAALGVGFDMALARAMVGRNFVDCATMVRAHFGADYPVDALLGRWHATYDGIVERDGLALKPGVDELLVWLEDLAVPRAVATSTRRERARSEARRTALLSRFHELVGGDEVPLGKPAPDIYVEAARRLGATRGRVRRARGLGAGRARGTRRGHDADHGAGLASAIRDLVALDVLVLPTLHEVLRHLAALPA